MKSAADIRARLLAWLPFLIVTAFGSWLLWPVPVGVMPLSADHTVHLTRAALYGEQLAGGHLVGWSPAWFFGFPLGELYPVLGDLGVVALRALSLGLLDWAQAYALLFTLVFLAQGWVLLRVGRAIGWGPIPGLVAALLALADVGAYREGGWIYTVVYGVWPQTLATSLAWLAFAELARAREPVPSDILSALASPVPPDSHKAAAATGRGAAASAGLAAYVPPDSHNAADASLDPAGPVSSVLSDISAGPLSPVSSDIQKSVASLEPAGPASSVLSDRPRAAATRASAGPPSVASDSRPGRPIVRAALAAAGALLAHPMALMMLAFGAPLWLFIAGLRRDPGSPPPRDLFAGTLLQLLLALGLGLALAAWWLLPMAAHRGWMASYGWLHAPLADMLRWAARGQWAQGMPAAVGHAAGLGLLAAAVVGRAPLRFFAVWTVLHWLLASTDVFWSLRLDWLSAGFSHIQYQRFLIAAKPGIYLLAGAAVGGLVHLAVRTWSQGQLSPRRRRPLAAGLAAVGLALAVWQGLGVRAAAERHHVGEVQTERVPGEPGFADDYAAFLAWARAQWDARDADYRIAVRADRNAHWFMDSPVVTRTPTYKLGFTPGDNFVHKPESGDLLLLRRLGVRFLVGTGSVAPAGTTLAARFGKIHVFELAARDDLARLEPAGGGVVVEHADLAAGRVRVRVAGARPGADLVLHVAGYPRWDLSFEPADGGPAEPVEWFEVPAIGDGPIATQEDRRAGRLRGGKALGDDGREPTLIAAPARDGVYELRYARWRRADILGLGLALAALAALVALARARRPPFARVHAVLRRLSRPAIVGAAVVLLLTIAVVRHRGGAARERDLASARVAAAATRGMLAGPLKTDMLIFPAVLARPDRGGRSEATFADVQLGANLDGWYAIDDDDAKQRRRGDHRLTISVRPAGASDWAVLLDVPVAHRPDRRMLDSIAVPPALQGQPLDLRVVVSTTGEQPPRLGFDLRLR